MDQLSKFTCAVPPKPPPGYKGRPIKTKPWEAEMQGMIRQLDPRTDDGCEILLKFIGAHLAAVVVVAKHQRDPMRIMVEGAAVAVPFQGQGLGKEAMDRALDWAQDQAELAELTRVTVLAKAHPKNTPSNKILAGFGFVCTEPDDIAAGWSLTMDWS